MDNEQDSIIPEGGLKAAPKIDSSDIKKPAPKRVKPIVEGINSPATPAEAKPGNDVVVVKSNLTQQEKNLISDQPAAQPEPQKAQFRPEERLMPESLAKSVNKKNHHLGRWFLVFVVLLILVAGGYEFYNWELGKGQTPVLGHYHPVYDSGQNNPTQTEPATNTTTPVVIPTSTPVSITSSTTIPTAVGKVNQIKINSTPTGFLNVRDNPSSSGKVLTQVHPGEVYTYFKVQNGWYLISYSGFSQGWVSGQYVTKQ